VMLSAGVEHHAYTDALEPVPANVRAALVKDLA
jgi:hypothetical protein